MKEDGVAMLVFIPCCNVDYFKSVIYIFEFLKYNINKWYMICNVIDSVYISYFGVGVEVFMIAWQLYSYFGVGVKEAD